MGRRREDLEEHGVVKSYRAGCRCGPCGLAWSDYEAALAEAKERGDAPMVDAGPTRLKLRELLDAGMHQAAIASAAGLGEDVISRLIRGKGGEPPQQTIHRETAERIAAVRLDSLVRRQGIDATGACRRVRALSWKGWRRNAIADGAAVGHTVVGGLLAGKPVCRPEVAEKLRVFYDSHWRLDGGSHATHWRAVRKGWAPPGAWDDDAIDDPEARPNFGTAPELADLNQSLLVELQWAESDRRRQLELLAHNHIRSDQALRYLAVSEDALRYWMAKTGITLKSRPVGRPRKEVA